MTSNYPLRPAGLALLLSEQTKENTMQIYAGNVLWSILSALHAFAKNTLELPTYSDVWKMVVNGESEADRQKYARSEADAIRESVWNSLNRFSKK